MPQTHLEPIFNQLEHNLKGKVVILGVGNLLRSDDAFGSKLAARLKDRVIFKVFDTGPAPENFLGVIKREKPNTVLIIDAVDFGGKVAEIKLFDVADVKTANFFFTHNTSLTLLFDFLKNDLNAKFYLLAIQPKRIEFQEGMSQEMEEKFKELSLWFLKKYPKN